MSFVKRHPLTVTVVLSIIAEVCSDALQRWVVEPRLAAPMSGITEASPLFPLLIVPLLVGWLPRSFKDGLLHAVVITGVVLILGVTMAWMTGMEYAHDIRVSDSGFLPFFAVKGLVLFGFAALLVEMTIVLRTVSRRIRSGV